MTVLIVDDEPDMRLYVRSCLRSLGERIEGVLEAADGLDALPHVRAGAVNLVITDVVLPRMDGYELCRAIKDDPELRHIAVLLISGDDRLGSRRGEGDGFLAKPFNTKQLMAALEQLPVRQPRAPP